MYVCMYVFYQALWYALYATRRCVTAVCCVVVFFIEFVTSCLTFFLFRLLLLYEMVLRICADSLRSSKGAVRDIFRYAGADSLKLCQWPRRHIHLWVAVV